MKLTQEQQAILDGARGETMAKVVETLVAYGDTFRAERMVPITGQYGHTVISFGLGIMKPVYDLYNELIEAGLTGGQRFTADPRPMDDKVPASPLEKLVFKKFMYSQQERLEEQMRKLGLTSDDDYTCTCYLPQVGNIPKRGEVLSWAESSAVVYANSVLGARCNRNSGIIELFGSIAGFVPEFGLLTDEGRKASWVVEVRCEKMPEAQLLGSAIGMKVMEQVPYIRGLDKWLGTELDDKTCAYLKDFGAATASNGAVGLYHIENLTPEAKDMGEDLIAEGAQVYVVDDAELERVKRSYPVVWKNADAKPRLCFVGCPHLTLQQLIDWTCAIDEGLRKNGLSRVSVPTVFTAASAVLREFEKTPYAETLRRCGVITGSLCPLMYMNNPLCKKKAVITCSNKLRTYSSARFYSEDEILTIITGREGRL
ncbi:MAG: aconitase X [Oscillospiraceae bacterium]